MDAPGTRIFAPLPDSYAQTFARERLRLQPWIDAVREAAGDSVLDLGPAAYDRYKAAALALAAEGLRGR